MPSPIMAISPSFLKFSMITAFSEGEALHEQCLEHGSTAENKSIIIPYFDIVYNKQHCLPKVKRGDLFSQEKDN